MTTKTKEDSWKGASERRKKKKPRRRLVDLTLKPGTDRREGEKDRRKAGLDKKAEEEND